MSNRIWIIDPYSDIPQIGWRDGRYFSMAKILSENNYDVNLFVSNVSHRSKIVINNIENIKINENFNIVVIPSSTYSGHISFQRIKYEMLFAKNVAINKNDIPLPNYIILKEPALFMFNHLEPLFKISNAKLILDIMDLWPELFSIKLPKIFRWMSSLLFLPFFWKRAKIIKFASALMAVSPDYLKIGTNINKRAPSEVIYWGCSFDLINKLANKKDQNLLFKLGLPVKKSTDIWGIYAGTLGESYDISSLILAAKSLSNSYSQLKIIIAGAGPLEGLVLSSERETSNIFYLGNLQSEELYELFGFCDFGFSTYSESSTVSMPIKCFDYFAAGLPLVNSLKRNLGSLIVHNNLGYQYQASNAKSLELTLERLIKEFDQLKFVKNNCLELGAKFDNSIQYKNFLNFIKKIDSSKYSDNLS
jgi:glycosyltransferase involved in cell wall biosynthesis